MALTEIQKATCQAIVGIYETSKLNNTPKAYAVVTNLKGDKGGLTYGKHQVTINSGNLFLLLKDYIETDEANEDYKNGFATYMSAVQKKSSALATDPIFKKLLSDAALNDPIMRGVQDRFFDRVYWKPALAQFQEFNFQYSLSMAVIYDSFIHGSWNARKNDTIDAFATPDTNNEQKWIRNYIEVRRDWLSSASELLSHTVYRMDEFTKIVKANNWQLDLPFVVKGVNITVEALGVETDDIDNLDQTVPERDCDERADDANETVGRLLFYTTPNMVGPDVEKVQQRLRNLGYTIKPDGIFGQKTKNVVVSFQVSRKLKPDGVIGIATLRALYA